MWGRLQIDNSRGEGANPYDQSGVASSATRQLTFGDREETKAYGGIRGIIRGVLALVLPLFLTFPVLAIPTVIVTGVSIQPDGSYYTEITAGQTAVVTIKIQNTENTTYRYYIDYNGQLATTLKRGTTVLASGSVFTTGYTTINPQVTHFLYLSYTPNQVGTYTNNIKVYFEKQVSVNNTTTWESAGQTSIVLQIKVLGSTSEETTQTTTTVTGCLQPLRTKIYKVVYLNSSLDFSVNVINACDNVNLTLVDADLEGVPPQIAYIKDTELRTLAPGEIQTIKIHFNSRDITKPTTVEFSLVISGKYGSKFETSTVDIVINVISKEQITSAAPSSEKAPQLKVDYAVQEGYLIIKGAYYEVNNTRIYMPDVPVEILYEGRKTTYMGPIPVEPGKTYCISAAARGFVPFFKCFTAPEKSLCISLEPEGADVRGKLYYKINTRVKLDMVYDCDTGDLIREYKIFYAGKFLTKDEFTVSDATCKVLKVTAEGYKEWQKEICGYSKLYVSSSLPSQVGNYTIRLAGTFIPGTVIKLEKEDPTGTKVVGQWTTTEFRISIKEPGDYKLIIHTPIYEDSYTFHVASAGSPISPSSFRTAIFIATIGLIGFLVLTLLMYSLVKKHRRMDMAQALTELDEKLKKLK